MQLSNSAPQPRAGSSSQTTGIAVSNAKTFQSPTVLEPKTGEKPTLPLPSIFKEGPRRFRFASMFPDGAAQRHRVVGGGDIGRRFCRVKRFFKKIRAARRRRSGLWKTIYLDKALLRPWFSLK